MDPSPLLMVHPYLGIGLDYSITGEVSVSMIPYMQEIVDEFPKDLSMGKAKTPAAAHLFDINPDPENLLVKLVDISHHTVAKLLWVSLRARPDILLVISFLTSRIKKVDNDDWARLTRLLLCIRGALDLKLRLTLGGAGVAKWWVDAFFATRAEKKSQTGGCLSMRNVSVFSLCIKITRVLCYWRKMVCLPILGGSCLLIFVSTLSRIELLLESYQSNITP